MWRALLIILVGLIIPCTATADIVNFDDLAPGEIVSEINGVSFSSSVSGYGLNLVVSTGNLTTSMSNYLGVDDSFSDLFLGGDEIYLEFAVPVKSLSVSFISTANTDEGVYSIETPYATVSNGLADLVFDPEDPFSDEVFVVTVVSDTPFTTASLISDLGVQSFNIDDIEFQPVPLPGAIWLLASGFGLIAFKKNRR